MSADFARLVSLACHDLRTPLATVQGFAKTLLRSGTPADQQERYLGMIEAASSELVELTERLSLLARIEGGRYEPVTREADSLELVRFGAAAAQGRGTAVVVDVEAVERGLADLVRAVARHGGVEPAVSVEGATVRISPVDEVVGAIALGEDAKDLGSVVAVRLVRALGGSAAVDDGALVVQLPR